MATRTVHPISFGRTVALGVLLTLALSCGRTADADLVVETIEASARQLQAGNAVEHETEALFEAGGQWTILLIPSSGVDPEALARAGLAGALVSRVTEASASWSVGQQLVQVTDEAVRSWTLAEDSVRVRQQLFTSGQGAAWIVVRMNKRRSDGGVEVTALTNRRR